MKLLTIKVSEIQFNALYRLEEVTGKNRSEIVRDLLAGNCAEHGIDFPNDVAKRGNPQWHKPQKLETD